MSWTEFLTLMLESTNKVDKAAIFNRKGQPLATTEDLQITDADGRALLSCLQDPAHSLTRICLDGTDFRCFQGNASSLVGRAAGDARRVLVARLTEDALIVVVGNTTGHGSFLYEVQHHLEERERRRQQRQSQLQGQSQVESQSRSRVPSSSQGGVGEGVGVTVNGGGSTPAGVLPPPPPAAASQHLSGRGASGDDVLLQLHD